MKKTHILAILLSLGCFGIGGAKISAREAVAQESITASSFSNETLVNSAVDLKIRAKSAYLMDFGTGTPVFSQNEKEHLPIASMCKIMTLILTFDALRSGAISMDEEVVVSEKAASMGGSQVFLEANAKYKVRDLMKSIVICSANDSCVALAEKICGSESIFVDKMNERAKGLGANDTLFANSTGLPKEPQYSCAKDVAIMLKELLKNPEYFEFGKVWMDKFEHPEGRFTEISNTNKLVRFYDGCDGGKTGFTNQAGFCLAATAKRGDLRVISVIIGAENSANRFEDTKTMFNYVFANYTVTPVVKEGVVLEEETRVNGGKENHLQGYPQRSSYQFSKKGEKANVYTQTQFYELRAPIQKGDVIGEIRVYNEGVEVDNVPLLAEKDIAKANVFDRLRDVARNWNKRK